MPNIIWSKPDSDGWQTTTNAPPVGMTLKFKQISSDTFKFVGIKNSIVNINPPSEPPGSYAEGTLQFTSSTEFTGTQSSSNLWSGTQHMTYTDDSIGTTYSDSSKTTVIGGWDDTYTGTSDLTVTNGSMSDGTGHYEYEGSITYTNNLIPLTDPAKTVSANFDVVIENGTRKLIGTFIIDGNTIHDGDWEHEL